MVETTPLVTVVTPSYNQGEFIEDTIKSVQQQNYKNIEHIVIDGGSTDSTLDILEKRSNIGGLKYISEPDRGQSHAINKGFQKAKGDLIGWLNSDDVYFHTNVVTEAVNAFVDDDAEVVYSNLAEIDKDNTIRSVVNSRKFDRQVLKRWNFIHQPATFFSGEVVENFKLDESLDYTMDYDYWLRISEEYDFEYHSGVWAAFRLHEGQKTFVGSSERPPVAVHDPNTLSVPEFISDKYRRLKDRIASALTALTLPNRSNKLAFSGEYPHRVKLAKQSLIF